jgi:hypothetical protein
MADDAPDCCRRSFAASIKDTARRLLEDPTIAPREVSRQRLEICEKCDFYQSNSKICDQCGCFLPLKTTMANMKCPIDKWTEHNRAD